MYRKLLAALVASTLLCACGSATAESAVQKVIVRITADTRIKSTRCPSEMNFRGTIVLFGKLDPHAPIEMAYQFLRDDNANSEVFHYTMDGRWSFKGRKAGPQPIDYGWPFLASP